MNLLFPVSVTLSTVAAVLLVQAAARRRGRRLRGRGFTFLATLMALAVLEHWFLVLPLPAAACGTGPAFAPMRRAGAAPKPHARPAERRPLARAGSSTPTERRFGRGGP